jgi:hypothetical protein
MEEAIKKVIFPHSNPKTTTSGKTAIYTKSHTGKLEKGCLPELPPTRTF